MKRFSPVDIMVAISLAIVLVYVILFATSCSDPMYPQVIEDCDFIVCQDHDVEHEETHADGSATFQCIWKCAHGVGENGEFRYMMEWRLEPDGECWEWVRAVEGESKCDPWD
jgi:hypothetical protein